MKVEWGGLIFGYDFVISFFLGGIVLTLVCYERFGQPIKTKESFVSTLLPEHLALKEDYLKAFLVYLLIMLIIYFLASMIGPSVYKAFRLSNGLESQMTGYNPSADASANGIKTVFEQWEKTKAPAWIPLLVMIILSGFSTKYKAFNQIELIVRKLTHRIIGIPDNIEELANNLQLARIDIGSLNLYDQKFIKKNFKFATGRDMSDIHHYYQEVERADPIRRWVRLQFLYDRLENKRLSIGRVLDVRVMEHYSNMWNEIKIAVYDLKNSEDLQLIDKTSEYNTEPQYLAKIQSIESKIDNTLHNIHALIAASIARYCKSSESAAEALAALGLSFKDVEKRDFINAIIAGILVMTIAVFLIVFITSQLGRRFGGTIYEALPQKPYDAFVWATGALFLHGAAALSGWKFQENRRKKKHWKPLHIRKYRIPSKQYLLLSIQVYFYSTLSLLFWWFVTEMLKPGPFTGLSIRQIWIPLFGLVGIVTGIYVAYTIDLCMRSQLSTLRMASQPVFQAVFTSLLSYIIMSILLTESSKYALSVYVGAVTALQGLIIGLIVLAMARQIYLQRRSK